MYQKCVFVGRLGKDPQINTLPSGAKVAQFSLACNEHGYKKADGTEVPERTDWIPCVLWNGLANVCEKYIRKGSVVLVEGKIRTRSYEKDGQVKYVWEVYADAMQMMGGSQNAAPLPPEVGGGMSQSDGSNHSGAVASEQKPAPVPSAKVMEAAKKLNAAFGDDDGLPY